MASRRYQNLFFIRLAHSGYAKANRRLFRLEPTHECVEVMNNLDLSLYQSGEGFSVAAPVKPAVINDEAQFQLQIPVTQEQMKLGFVLFSDNLNFYPASYLPFDPPGEFVYSFDNLDGSSGRTRSLTADSGITADLRLPMVSGAILGAVAAGSDAALPKLWDANDKAVSLTIRLRVNDGQYRIDLGGLSAGRYRLLDGQGQRELYVCLASFARRVPIAVIDLYLHRLVDSAYQIIDYRPPWQADTPAAKIAQFIRPQQWALHFGRFRFYWRYRIKGRYRIKMAGLADVAPCYWAHQIKSADNSLIFAPDFELGNDPEQDLVFTSTRTVHLAEDLPMLTLCLYGLHHHHGHHGHDDHNEHNEHHGHNDKHWQLFRQVLGSLPQPQAQAEQGGLTFVEEAGKLIGEMCYSVESVDDFAHEQQVDPEDHPDIWAALMALCQGHDHHDKEEDKMGEK